MAAALRTTEVFVTAGRQDVEQAVSEEDIEHRLAELADGLITAASELRRLTADLREGRHAGPSG